MDARRIMSLITVGLMVWFSGCFERHPGEQLFKNPKFAESGNFKSCNYCHSQGSKLGNFTTKTEFIVEGKIYRSVQELVNQVMIIERLKGFPILNESQEMKDLLDYLSLFE